MKDDRKEAIEEDAKLSQMQATELKISVLPQYAQDYMQAYATARARVSCLCPRSHGWGTPTTVHW